MLQGPSFSGFSNSNRYIRMYAGHSLRQRHTNQSHNEPTRGANLWPNQDRPLVLNIFCNNQRRSTRDRSDAGIG